MARKTVSLVRLVQRCALLAVLGAVVGPRQSVAQTPVTTYHNDNFRTGWNQNETTLTPTAVASPAFGWMATVPLDEQVDAEPLYVPNVTMTIGGKTGLHNVVYVVTENNTVYAIGAGNFAVLVKRNLGTPVYYPLNCHANGPYVGINSTPVLDPVASTLYVMTYVQQTGGPQYLLHALDLATLADKVTPQVVSASHTLADGSTFAFSPVYERQRPGLLLANGNVYAGFGSWCDMGTSMSRGWVLGWNSTSLTPMASNQVLDTQGSSPDNYFLSAIWMSGYALTADGNGNVLFVTGNSDFSGTTYDGVTNLQESVVKVSPDLSVVQSLFTPANQAALDANDQDFGSGGVMVLPPQSGSIPNLAVAAGKTGQMFLMNEDKLGGYSPTKNNVLGTYSIGTCFCGPSYYVGADGQPRVVSSGGHVVNVWKLATAAKPTLSLITSSPSIASGQSPGFFTSISSNGNSNAIIWALSHPLSSASPAITLYAFNPAVNGTMPLLFSGPAGSWPNYKGNANLVPMVANGHVFVASNKQLQIFGLRAVPATTK